jgi:hypothetical protein
MEEEKDKNWKINWQNKMGTHRTKGKRIIPALHGPNIFPDLMSCTNFASFIW